MNMNKALWDKVSKTDPRHVKPITGKDYGGNSPKPYYIVERLTEEFGPCGLGWGYVIESERFERFSDTDVLHVAKVRLWYVTADGRRGEVEQMGQTKATYMTSKGMFKVDEDAPKKSVTDALVKCASYLGFAGDIFAGRWDDSKYVAELKREFSQKAANAEASEQAVERKRTGVAQDVLAESPPIPEERQDELRELALTAIDDFNAYGAQAAYERLEEVTDAVERIYLGTLMEAKVRNGIKAYSMELHKQRKAA
jgi:hypothetical protein